MDDWQVGDLALCVAPEAQLVSGGVYTVSLIFFGSDDFESGWALSLVEAPDPIIGGEQYDGYDAWRFRKIRPLSDEERASFLADLDAPVSPADARPRIGTPESASVPNRAGLSGDDFIRFHGHTPSSQVQQ